MLLHSDAARPNVILEVSISNCSSQMNFQKGAVLLLKKKALQLN